MTVTGAPDSAAERARLADFSREHEEAGRPAEALAAAWQGLDLAPADLESKRRVVQLLHRHSAAVPAERREDLARLLVDPEIEPAAVARAGWRTLLAANDPFAARAGDPEALAPWAETDALTLRLLEQSPVTILDAERALTGLRRWLLLSGRWTGLPKLVAALAAQAAHNDGAWLATAEEKALLDSAPPGIAAAYFPPAPAPPRRAGFDEPVTRAVAAQYEDWPFPAWSRITPPKPQTLPAMIAELDGGRPSPLPVDAELLVAGCGTGREAALWALRFPDARITAIDLSETSLAYARERCRAIGIERIDFRRLDLHRVAELGKSFDFISCCGVLHHLADPEGGWAALVEALRPGGAMRIMLYSKIARLKVRAAQRHLADLRDRPTDPHLLREARRRLIERAPDLLGSWPDFYTLSGVHDLLLHRHEDAFDVPRIVRALDRLGLELLAFDLPTPWHRARYRQDHPNDPAFRDVEAWAALEKRSPLLFQKMYNFHCRKPGS